MPGSKLALPTLARCAASSRGILKFVRPPGGQARLCRPRCPIEATSGIGSSLFDCVTVLSRRRDPQPIEVAAAAAGSGGVNSGSRGGQPAPEYTVVRRFLFPVPHPTRTLFPCFADSVDPAA